MQTLTFLAALFTGCLGAFLAHRKGKNPYGWFFIGFFFGILGTFAIFFAPKKKKKTTRVKQLYIPTIQGPKDKFWYYADKDHNQVGPISHDAINGLWKDKTIDNATLVWHQDLTDWKPLKELIKKMPLPTEIQNLSSG